MQDFETPAFMSAITEHSPEAAAEVFGTVELMEGILLRLNVPDIFHAMQVTRSMRDTVLGSSKLQKHMGLIPDHKSHFTLPLWPEENRSPSYAGPSSEFHGIKLDHFSNRFDGRYDFDEDGIQLYADPPRPDLIKGAHFRLEVRPCSRAAEPLGSRVSHILICQPPIREMGWYWECSLCGLNANTGSQEPFSSLLPRVGQYFTIGDVRSAAVRIRESHEADCDSDRGPSYDYHGLNIFFGGKIEVLPDEDLLNLRRAWETIEWKQRYAEGE